MKAARLSRLSRRVTGAAVVALIGAAALTAVAGLTAGALVGGAGLASAATPYKVLFDNTLAETAGNADWIISTSQPDPLAQNANPTSETSWTGAISAWGVALQRTSRYSLKTLPSGGSISYGNSGNALDLADFNAFVLPEPNVQLSATAKTAIMKFVQNGGGLFMISDHTGSDRNNDGWDSPKILNDLMTSNGVDNTDPFGFSIDLLNIANENPNVIGASAGSDPIIAGPFGHSTGTILRNGTTVTLKPSDNSSVRGEIYRSGYSASGTTGVAVASSTFGSGRVMFIGDSSAIDDGTGQSGNTLYNGWNDPAGTDSTVMLNGTEWLASGGTGGSGSVTVTNPGSRTGTVGTATSLQLSASGGSSPYTWTATGLPPGLSISSAGLISGTPSTAGTYTVTVTARDTTGATGSATFSWTISSSGGTCSGQKLGNPGFETGTASPWTATSGVISNNASEPPHSGSWDAWLDGYGTATTDTVSQSVTIPSGCTATFSFYLHIDTAETTTTTAYDKLTVKAGSTTLATYSNLNKNTGYALKSFTISGGQTVSLSFAGVEDSTLQTSFVVDDTALVLS
ncbi:MAG: putative Ig domain-containing protein [Jatrophihabitantaceae bacterium]